MTAILIACGGALIAATVSVVTLLLNRKWAKEDRKSDKLDAIRSEVAAVRRTLTDHIAADAEADAKQARRRIIAFSDECRRGTRHSEEHFDNVLEDVDAYETYCNTHPTFANRKAVQSIRFIVDVYDRCKRTNDFI